MAGVGEMWEMLKQAIAAYTGLSPAALFTAVAVAAAVYHVAAGLFQAPTPRRREVGSEAEDAAEPLPPPVELGEVTEDELRAFDGSDPKKPLLMAIKSQIYDVSQSRSPFLSLDIGKEEQQRRGVHGGAALERGEPARGHAVGADEVPGPLDVVPHAARRHLCTTLLIVEAEVALPRPFPPPRTRTWSTVEGLDPKATVATGRRGGGLGATAPGRRRRCGGG